MLSVYSTQRSIFVIRSALEGVCSWLRTAMGAHAKRMGVPTPSFVNAGDGLFTHPIGEFVGGSRLGQFASQGVLGQFTWCTTLSRWTTVFSFG
ncbi:Protein PyrBI [Includes: Aspartate carbamoyltransferase (Aspartate transcarbamylase) (ATCase) [Durusdinium trenchii]|uniref:Protein PyrBI n=1 Tax=Durusdinium trenchii TaxID=1381693 RepID=A0ABP0R423_9DINO